MEKWIKQVRKWKVNEDVLPESQQNFVSEFASAQSPFFWKGSENADGEFSFVVLICIFSDDMRPSSPLFKVAGEDVISILLLLACALAW